VLRRESGGILRNKDEKSGIYEKILREETMLKGERSFRQEGTFRVADRLLENNEDHFLQVGGERGYSGKQAGGTGHKYHSLQGGGLGMCGSL